MATTPLKEQYRAWVQKYAQQYGVDPNLAEAMIIQESANQPTAVSIKGAAGLTQLMPGTAAEMGVTDINDPEQQIAAGIKYLGIQLKSFGDVPTALAAYNAGPGAVRKYNGIPPYKETINYVDRIIKNYNSTKAANPASATAAPQQLDPQAKALQDANTGTANAYTAAANATQTGISQIDSLMKNMPDTAAAARTAGAASIQSINDLTAASQSAVDKTFQQLAAGDATRRQILTTMLGRNDFNPMDTQSVAADTATNLTTLQSQMNATVAAAQAVDRATLSTAPADYIQRMLLGNPYESGLQTLQTQFDTLSATDTKTKAALQSNAALATDMATPDPQLLKDKMNADLKLAELKAKGIETQGNVAVDVAKAESDKISSMAQMLGYRTNLANTQAQQLGQAAQATADAVTAPIDLAAKLAGLKSAEANATVAGMEADRAVKFNEQKSALDKLTMEVQTEQQRSALITAKVQLDNVEKLAANGQLSDAEYYKAMAAASEARQVFGANFVAETAGTAVNKAKSDAADATAAAAQAPLRNAATQVELTAKANEYANIVGEQNAIKDGAAKLGITSPTNTEKLTPEQKTALLSGSAGGKLAANPAMAARVAVELGVQNNPKYPGMAATVNAIGSLRVLDAEGRPKPVAVLDAKEVARLTPADILEKVSTQFLTVGLESSVFNGNANPYGLVPPIQEFVPYIKDENLKKVLSTSPPVAEDLISLSTFTEYLKHQSQGKSADAGKMLAEYARASADFNNKTKGFELLGLPAQTGLNLDSEGDISDPATAIKYVIHTKLRTSAW